MKKDEELTPEEFERNMANMTPRQLAYMKQLNRRTTLKVIRKQEQETKQEYKRQNLCI